MNRVSVSISRGADSVRRRVRVAAAFFVTISATTVWVAAAGVVVAASDCELQIVALSSNPPTGTVAAGEFAHFDEAPVINNAGDVAFLAGSSAAIGLPLMGATSVWQHGSGGLQLVAQSDQAAPLSESAPVGGAVFRQFSDVLINNAGTVAFQADLAENNSGPRLDSLWLASGGGLDVVAHTGMHAPGLDPGTTFDKFVTVPALADDGALAFFSFTRAAGPNPLPIPSLWIGDRTSLDVVAHTGAPAVPGEPDSTFHPQTFVIPFGYQPVITSGRFTMLRGFLQGPGITTENGLGLWQYNAENGRQITMRSGAAGEGTGGDPFLSFPNVPGINHHGQFLFTAFFGRLDTIGDPVEPVAGEGGASGEEVAEERLSLGIWSNRTGPIEPIFRLGDPADGIEGHARFVDFTRPIMNEAGAMAFHGIVEGDGIDDMNHFGVWSEGLTGWGDLALVARMGDHAPGTAEEIVFQTFHDLAMNSRGQLAFLANVRGPGISDATGNVVGLWAQDKFGELRLIARSGDPLVLGPSDERTIAGIAFAAESGGDDGRSIGLNDRGQIAFRALFTDGTTGILVSSAVATPEPSTLVLVLTGLAVIGVIHRRKQFESTARLTTYER